MPSLLNSLLDIDSISGIAIVKNMTEAERDALTPSPGMLIFNTTTDKLQCYDGSVWPDCF